MVVELDRIDTALRRDGAAGPCGLDTATCKCLFKSASTDLYEVLAATARWICTNYVDPEGLAAFVACQLIALDKCPGIHPIGIGEIIQCIIGRAIATILSDDIQAVAGPTQLCASGCGTAVHAMLHIFQSPEAEPAILVDSSNAFNSLNVQVALRNIYHLCPPLSKALINTYREDIQFFVGGEALLSPGGHNSGGSTGHGNVCDSHHPPHPLTQ